jgi:DHA2 family multidrug resistance protein-like MFS transporter
MVAGAIGVAVIGSALSTVYSSSFGKAVAAIPQLTTEIVEAASDSVGTAVTIAQQLPSPLNETLAQIAKESFMDGWQVMAFVTCGLSIVGAIVILKFMPPRHGPAV